MHCYRFFAILPLALMSASRASAQVATAYKDAAGAPALQMYLESMYLPSVTRGPWSPAWSPDGRELAFAMHGSLWKVPVGGGVAEQITDGPDYDSQPQWSPDGRRLVFTRDNGNAMVICLVNADGSSLRQITRSGAINVDPEWHSSDRIIYSSNSESKNMTLWGAAADGSGTEPVLAGTDQNVEPASSPDGKWIAFLSNREIAPGKPMLYGSGNLWKVSTADKTLQLILQQETLWHTRPRWSPDGRRIAYVSSQTGRNQLFILDADTGISAQLTYAKAEPFTPSWSPNGERIAFVSNADHHFTLMMISASGGLASPVAIAGLRWRQPMARLRVTVRDETGKPTWARLSIRGSDGKSWAPEGALERVSIVTGDHYFYPRSLGAFTVDVPVGSLKVATMKGLQYHPQERRVEISAHQVKTASFSLRRLTNLERQGWYSGDNLIHMNYGGVYGETPKSLVQEAGAEDLDVVGVAPTNLLTHLIDYSYFTGTPDPLFGGDHLLYFNEEYRPALGGHLALLGMKQFFFPVYDGYRGTPYAADYPSNAQVLDHIHSQGAIGGYVHPYFENRDQEPFSTGEGAREFPADAVLGKVDFYDLMCIFTDKYVVGDVLYRIWNLGIRVSASAGTDVMSDYWRAPTIGGVRVFVHSGSPLNYHHWLNSLKEGRSFVTNGPLLRFTVNGHGSGDELLLPEGATSSVRVNAEAISIFPMDQLDILQDGVAVATEKAGNVHRIRLSYTIPVKRSGWIAVRASGSERIHGLTDSYVYAHSNPVWLVKGSQKPSSPSDAEYFVHWMDTALRHISEKGTFFTDAQRSDVMAVYAAARERFQALAERVRDAN